MSQLLPRSDWNATREPSGLIAAAQSQAPSLVRHTWPEPSLFISHISGLPFWVEVKAILLPSAEHEGQVPLPPLGANAVSRVRPVPSGEIASISLSEAKMMLPGN